MKKPSFCYCGHQTARHMYTEPPIGGWSPGDPDPELEFTHCAGMAAHGDLKEVCKCKGFTEFTLGVYKHVKTGNLYEVVALGFNAEDRSVEVEYVSLSHGERWHRPLYTPAGEKKKRGFLEPDEATGKPRYVYLPCVCIPQPGKFGMFIHANGCPQIPHVEDINKLTVEMFEVS